MSVIKNCNICGEKISIRKMPSGQWVAFDHNSEKPHVHAKKKINKTKDIKYDRVSSNIDIIDLIDYAIEKKITLELSYVDRKKDYTTRKVHPIKLYENEKPMIFEAFCLLRKENRNFRLDRIKYIKETGVRYKKIYTSSNQPHGIWEKEEDYSDKNRYQDNYSLKESKNNKSEGIPGWIWVLAILFIAFYIFS